MDEEYRKKYFKNVFIDDEQRLENVINCRLL